MRRDRGFLLYVVIEKGGREGESKRKEGKKEIEIEKEKMG